MSIELENTKEAFAQLNLEIDGLIQAILSKKDELVKQDKLQTSLFDQSEEGRLLLQNTSKNVVNNINSMIEKLYKILEKDGSDNDNN